MKRFDLKNIALLGGYLLILYGLLFLRPDEIDWSETYDIDDTIPYASKLPYDLFSHSMGPTQCNILDQSWSDREEKLPVESNLIFIGNELLIDKKEYADLMDWVRQGGYLFIAATQVQTLADSFQLRWKTQWPSYTIEDTTALIRRGVRVGLSSETSVDTFIIFTSGFYKTLTQLHTDNQDAIPWRDPFSSLSEDESGQAVFLSASMGNGKVFLHSVPKAFTNYQFARPEGAEYGLACLSVLPNRKSYWDVYHNEIGGRHGENSSLLRVLDESVPLKVAWYLLLLVGLIHLFWSGKRRQAVIPIIKPKTNRSLDFAMNVADLHYKYSDPRRMMMKRIHAFQVAMHGAYGLSVQDFSEKDKEEVAEKLQIPKKELDPLWIAILHTRQTKILEIADFLRYNRLFNDIISVKLNYD